MSPSEIIILALLAVIALQTYFTHRIIQASLDTMRSCSETTDMATELSIRVLDDLVEAHAQLPQVTEGARHD